MTGRGLTDGKEVGLRRITKFYLGRGFYTRIEFWVRVSSGDYRAQVKLGYSLKIRRRLYYL